MLAELFFLGLSFVAASGQSEDAVDAKGKHWALLVSGAWDWWNYRFQADVCHAYQILHKNGIPDENIVVMMYDDIAYNPSNPTPGIVINKPNGTDVYHGVPKDYTETDVNPQNFLNVLMGDKEDMNETGSGKVIESGPNDHIFVYFADHGGPGVLFFPDDELLAHELIDVINHMHAKKKFKKMVIYIEACKSGSMFYKKLRNNINVYVTTAANPNEDAYACYYDKERQIYLGDVYSANWMDNSDADLENETLSNYQGEGNGERSGVSPEEYNAEPITDAVPTSDVHLKTLQNRLRDAKSKMEKQQIINQIEELFKLKEEIRKIMEDIVTQCVSSTEQKVRVLKTQADPQNFHCYKQAVKTFSKSCYNLGKNEHAARHVNALSNLCEENISTEVIVSAIKKQCGRQNW